MAFRTVFWLIVVALIGLPVAAQSPPEWEVIALQITDDARALVQITPAGVETLAAVPDGLAGYASGLHLSPDRRYLAALAEDRNRVLIVDLELGTCCTELPFLDATPRIASLGGFSPDGTQIAVAYMTDDPYSAVITTLDFATGEVAAQTDMTEEGEGGILYFPELDSWREDGVHFWTLCTNCVEGAVDYQLEIWDPTTDAVTPFGAIVTDATDTLPSRRETLMPVYDDRYPATIDTDALAVGPERYGIRNAIVLSGARAGDGEAVVYFDGDNLDRVRWVADGNAFVVFGAPGGDNVVVLPDGNALPVAFAASQWIAATPDGWLTLEDGALQHYVLDGSNLTQREIGSFAGQPVVLDWTPLGESAVTPFVTVPPPEAVTCEGFVESRLRAGQMGRVLPGAANNVRAEPTTTSPIVARMAGGETFLVLEGPVCAQQLAWWRVSFRQWEGWTAEGSGQNYWLEPGE